MFSYIGFKNHLNKSKPNPAVTTLIDGCIVCLLEFIEISSHH
uniref:Uncharacterized protein n=1 Tax=Rhizophora mucronata TaxID=61149 RepID=A0A2P2N5B0_RHIMU